MPRLLPLVIGRFTDLLLGWCYKEVRNKQDATGQYAFGIEPAPVKLRLRTDLRMKPPGQRDVGAPTNFTNPT